MAIFCAVTIPILRYQGLEFSLTLIHNPNSLHRIEEEDGDDVYYLEENNGFVIVSIDGYIRTFFYPDDGLAYFNRQ